MSATDRIANAEAALAIYKDIEHPDTATVFEQLNKWRSEGGAANE